MPRKKKEIEPFIGPGKEPENKLIVQKSMPLFSLWRSDMTLAEFKILDVYLSRIDSHQPDKRTVIFSKGELEQLLGVKKINKSALSQRLNNLGRFVDIEEADHKIHKIALFEEAYGETDDYGLWQVKLTCTPAAMKYIFNVEELRYLRYKLRCISGLTSRYSYVFFMYLEKNRFRKTWEVGVDELRRALKCDAEESYKEFKLFNNRIIKKCQDELHEKSECRFAYKPIKKGRRVVAIKFTLETLSIMEISDFDPVQYVLEDGQPNDRDAICHGFSMPEFDDFTDEQLELLKALAWAKKRESDVDRHNEVLGDIGLACEYATTDFLRLKIAEAKFRKPKNLFLYVKKMLENN